MLPGVFNLIAFALVPLTAHVVNGELGPHPPLPIHEGPEITRSPPHPPFRKGPEIVRLPPHRPIHEGPEMVRLPPPPPFHERPETGHGGHRKRDWKPMEVTRNFQSYQSRVSNYGPSFEDACQNNHPEVLVNGLVDIRTSLVSLSAQVHASVGAWATPEIHTCADNYIGLLVKVQALLEIIHTHDRIDSCRDSILGLNVPLQALVSVFVKAGINVGSLLGARVNLSLLASIGISLGISANVEL